MVALIANISLYCAFLITFIVITLSVFKHLRNFQQLPYTTISVAIVTLLLLIVFVMAMLLYLDITTGSSVFNVYLNSYTEKSILFKMIKILDSNEGSMLLFITLSVFSTLIYFSLARDSVYIKNQVVIIQFSIISVLIYYSIFFANPFTLENFVFPQKIKMGSNLQNYLLLLYSIILYLGYAFTSIIFSTAIVYLIRGKFSVKNISNLKLWILLALFFIGSGSVLLNILIYEVIKFGGGWEWNPIQNFNLVLVLVLIILFYFTFISVKTAVFKNAIIFLSIVSYLISTICFIIIKTDIVISDVSLIFKSNANIFILTYLFILTLISLVIYTLRIYGTINNNKKSLRYFKKKATYKLISKESAVLLTSIITGFAIILIICGTLYPIFSEIILLKKITISKSYFNIITLATAIVVICIMPLAMLFKLHSDSIKNYIKLYKITIALSVILSVITIYCYQDNIEFNFKYLIVTFVLTIVYNLIFITIFLYLKKILLVETNKIIIFRRIKELSIHLTAPYIAYLGVGVFALGIIFTTVFSETKYKLMEMNDITTIQNFDIELVAIKYAVVNDYITRKLKFRFYKKDSLKNGKKTKLLKESWTEKRLFLFSKKTVSTEVAKYQHLLSNIYIIPEKMSDNGIYVKILYRPIFAYIWLGIALIIFSIFLAIVKYFNITPLKST